MPKKHRENMMNQFGVLLREKELRDGRVYMQKEIAEETGVSESTISRIMNGKMKRGVSYPAAVRLAKWFGVSVEDFDPLDEEIEPVN